MELKGKQIGVAITGSFCTYKKLFTELENLVLEGAEVQTIFSNSAQKTDSRFGNAEDFVKRAEEITGKKIMKTIAQAEPIGPKNILDLLIIMPDALGMNMKNIGLLMNAKNIYFVPFGQDNAEKKPNSMIAHTNLLIPVAKAALEGKQYQPIIQ